MKPKFRYHQKKQKALLQEKKAGGRFKLDQDFRKRISQLKRLDELKIFSFPMKGEF